LHGDFQAGYFVQIRPSSEFHGGSHSSFVVVVVTPQPYKGGTSFQRTVSWLMKLARKGFEKAAQTKLLKQTDKAVVIGATKGKQNLLA
jgi:hypothetical protein